MIFSAGITPLPTCPEQHRPSSETPKNDLAKFVGATDAPNANNHGGGSSSRDLRSIVF